MTSQVESLKSNEFLRRRKLRLLQVREQSKSLAKKVRQRTSEEILKQVSKSDSQKQRDNLDLKNKFVKELQEYFVQGVNHIGEGHKHATLVNEEDKHIKTDLSKLRGKAAAVELRKKKQEKLDAQKRLLDRKLQARDVANEISREKSLSLANKLCSKLSTEKQNSKASIKPVDGEVQDLKDNKTNEIDLENPQAIAHSDMATQCDAEETLKEWNPSIPALPLPSDEDLKESNTNLTTQKNKKLNLFTLSDDMPSSLRGGLSNTTNTYEKVKPSLTLVTEYLQARAMKLREPEPSVPSKKSVENLGEIRETIIRSRSTRTEGVCVMDGHVFQVPSWHAEHICPFCKQKTPKSNAIKQCSNYCSNYRYNAPNRLYRIGGNKYNIFSDKTSKTSAQSLLKKPSVTMYDHTTRDTTNIPYEDSEHVTRDKNYEDDAFIQAMKQNDIDSSITAQSNHADNIGKMRSKVAMSKLNVEKEYKDTMEFLNTIHKDRTGNPVIRQAYKDDQQEQESHNLQQQKLEQEYRKVEREHRKHICKKSNFMKPKSSAQKALEDEYVEDFKYSWMPVPESDDNLAIHTIPTTVKEPKSGNSVKFNKVDGYHEYRSRHKHTPPTKEPGNARNSNKKIVEAVFVEDIHESSATTESDNVSSENMPPEPVRKIAINQKHDSSDAERIIIYKIVESKKSKKDKKSPSKSSSILQKETKLSTADCNIEQSNLHSDNRDASNQVSLDRLNEGVYKGVAENGSNVSRLQYNSHQDNEKKYGNDPVGQRYKNTPLHWEVGVQPTTESKTTEPCNFGRLSSCNSASSFNHPADKANNVPPPDGGFIKMVDDDGKEAGKFYIGASGFLRDEAYEVIFQLRKKDCSKTVESNDKPVEGSNLNNQINAPEPSNAEICRDANPKPDNEMTSHLNKKEIEKLQETDVTANTVEPCLKESEQTEDVPMVSNASSLQPSFRPTDNIAVNSVLLKPSVTTCTQTSFSSPHDRPGFIHMSSSASTSYMSPPEKILPKIVRSKQRKSDHCRKNEKCLCQKCKFHRPDFTAKQNEFSRNLMTPPNTARSRYGKSESESGFGNKKKKHRCHKTSNRKNVKNKRNYSHYTALSNKAICYNFMPRMNSGTGSQNTNRGTVFKNKPELNPLIKKYVDNLLSLNRDSLKAIEVVNLECSSVSTPGSSIIATPHNLDQKNSGVEKKISLEQIKKYVEQRLTEKTQEMGQKTVRSNLNRSRDCFNFKNVATLPKKKQLHKVKSLNISKSLRKSVDTNTPQSNDVEKPLLNQKNIISTSTYKKPSTDLRKSPVYKKLIETKNIKLTNITEPKLKSAPSCNKSVETVISSLPILSDVKIPPINISPTESKPKPIHNATQTNYVVENDINFIKIAETKLENMEKIANLTEKCTTRLSNLAKVLEEVRKNKCTSYSHVSVSDGTSNSDQDFEKNTKSNVKMNTELVEPSYNKSNNLAATSPEMRCSSKNYDDFSDNNKFLHADKSNSNPKMLDKNGINQLILKGKAKPPPALANFGKYVTPHELSTVVEVDSPMSLIIKKQSPHSSSEEITKKGDKEQTHEILRQNKQIDNPDLLQNEISKSKENEDSAIGMLDLNQFNKIMLQPFISIQDYAKDVNTVSVDEASNLDDFTIPKEGNGIVTDDVSSMHSDGSLPDVVSELLKRKLIAEPFKFDSGSNENSTTISSDSTLSIFLKKSGQENRKKQVVMQDNDKVLDSSDTISISSNPDLENAFKKLGMGWASSTLKKTKERLALSSSSNTSSSSLGQFKVKNLNQEVPAVVTDSISSVTNVSKKRISDKSKNAEQQTVISNSMTVKEFLTTELSKKITFTRKPDRTGLTDEFISLYETKIPEELKESPTIRDQTQDQSQNGNNRARTSTPVQIFKSMTYRSSSTSNTSNGLFSNAEDLSSVKGSNSIRNHSTSDKDDLTIPNYSLKMRKSPDNSKSD